MRALHTAATGMMAQELNVQVISNNIANMRTTGYKRQRAEFQDLLYEHVRRVGTQTSDQGNQLPAGVELGAGVKTVGTPRLMTQGSLVQTGKDYDIAIRGEGFFQITLPDGRTAYSRDGSFELDSQGRMVAAQGNVLNPGLTIPQNATSVTVNAQGQVAATIPGTTTPTIVGQIHLADAALRQSDDENRTVHPSARCQHRIRHGADHRQRASPAEIRRKHFRRNRTHRRPHRERRGRCEHADFPCPRSRADRHGAV